MRMKKALSLIVCTALAFALCAAGLPETAYALNDVRINGITLPNGKYLASNGTAVQDTAPDTTVGYAYLSSDGATLTLNHFTYNATTQSAVEINGDIEIALTGESTVTSAYTAGGSTGVYCVSVLTVSGSGILNATGGNVTSGHSYGVHANGGFTLNGGSLNATGGSAAENSYGVCVEYGDITASSGTLTARGGSSGGTNYGVRATGRDIIVNGGTINATGGGTSGNYASSYGVYASRAIAVSSGALEGTGGSVTGTVSYSCGVFVFAEASTITVSGGSLKGTGGSSQADSSYGVYAPSGSVTVAAGELEGTGGSIANASKASMGVYTNRGINLNGGVTTARGAKQALSPAATLGSNVTAEASADMSGGAGLVAYTNQDSHNDDYKYFKSPATVAAPTFSPAGGAYPAAQSVELSCATAGATIRYTTDGGEPTATSAVYTAGSSINIVKTTTIKAKAFKSGMTESATASAAYTIPAPPITVSPSASFIKGGAPANVTITVGTASSAPASGHFGSLEISSNGAGFTAVPSANYDVTYGSIHIALHQSWLNALAAGTHTLRVNLAGEYAGVSPTTIITVTTAGGGAAGDARANPSTGVSAAQA